MSKIFLYVRVNKNVNMVDERNYFIIFKFFTTPPLGGAIKAVFLPHLLAPITSTNNNIPNIRVK